MCSFFLIQVLQFTRLEALGKVSPFKQFFINSKYHQTLPEKVQGVLLTVRNGIFISCSGSLSVSYRTRAALEVSPWQGEGCEREGRQRFHLALTFYLT